MSMMNFLKNQFLFRVYNKEINYGKKLKKFKHSNRIHNIAVILDGDLAVPEDLFIALGSVFGVSKGKIFLLTYSGLNKKDKNSYSKRCFSISDIGFFGKFNNRLNRFCSKNYDVLINYYDRNFLPMKLVSLRCKNKMSLGFGDVDHRLNDLILNIDITDNILFLSEAEKYLKLIYGGFKKRN
jgi:hypothetical protein